MVSSSSLRYLPFIIPYTIVIFLIVILAILVIYYRGCCKGRPAYETQYIDKEINHDSTANYTAENESTQISLINRQNFDLFFIGDQFEMCYWSHFGYSGTILLLIVRILSFLYLFGISFIYREIVDPRPPLTFTSWNIHLLWVYFLASSIASVIGLYFDGCLDTAGTYKSLSTFWSLPITRFGYVLQILYTVGGSSAFFVTTIAFAFLDHRFVFWNVSFHFVTFVAIIVELALNRFKVRWEHVVFCFTWSFVYILFTWIMVPIGVLRDWPYFFLDASTPIVFGWYFALLLMNGVFYFLFWGLSYVKHLLF